jgi:hypothetical protein
MLMLAAIPDDDIDRTMSLLSRLGYLIHQLRLQPDERTFYVPLILEFYRITRGTLPTLETENILEVLVARVMRNEYTSAAIMAKSLVARVKTASRSPRLPIHAPIVGLPP